MPLHVPSYPPRLQNSDKTHAAIYQDLQVATILTLKPINERYIGVSDGYFGSPGTKPALKSKITSTYAVHTYRSLSRDMGVRPRLTLKYSVSIPP